MCIRDRFDTDIGLPNANTDKRSRLNVDEVHSNDIATYSPADERLQRLREDCKRVENMFGITLSVDWRFPPQTGDDMTQEGGADNGSRV